jgi:DHA2 family multidrug resistance protein-like MFS transporter
MLALGPIAFGIKETAVHGAVGLLPLGAGIVFAVAFVRRQLRLEQPMLDMTLFRRTGFSGSLLVNLCSVIAMVGFLYFVSQHLQMIVGLSPMIAGLALLPGAVTAIVAGLGITPIAKRFSAAVVVPASLVLAVAAYLIVAFVGAHDVGMLILGFALLGAGVGAAETVSGELILANAPAAKAGAASAVSETAYELGAVLGTSILGGILTAWYRATLVVPSGVPGDLAAHAEETLAGAMNAAERVGGPAGEALRAAAAEAFDGGVTVTSLIGAGLVVLAAVIAATTLGRRRERALD